MVPMNTEVKKIESDETTDKIIKIFYKVYGKLGYSFLEKVYEKAMISSSKKGAPAVAQWPIRGKEVVENIWLVCCG